MITKLGLELYRRQGFGDVDTFMLKDITTIAIDGDKLVSERIRDFIEQIGNPYFFRVGAIPVKVGFARDGVTIERCLERILTKNL